MATGVVTAGAAAVALYLYLKQRPYCGGGPDDELIPACRDVEHPPNTWTESLYYFKEVLR